VTRPAPVIGRATGGDAMPSGRDDARGRQRQRPSSITVTSRPGGTFEPNRDHLPAISVATHHAGSAPSTRNVRRPTTGLCTITYSGVTSLTVAAVQLSQP
jgi:hypothetical protein